MQRGEQQSLDTSYETLDFIQTDYAASYGLLPHLMMTQSIPSNSSLLNVQMIPPPNEYLLSGGFTSTNSTTPKIHSSTSQSATSPPGDQERPEKRRKTVTTSLDPEKILEKNRESARESRRRKKEYIRSLEDKVTKLQTELQELRDRFDVYSQQAFNETIDERTNQLEEVLKKTPPKKHEDELIQAISVIHTLHTEQLKTTLGHYLEKTEQMMQPFPFAKFILWGLDHDDAFFEADKQSGGGLWTAIIKELEISEEQEQQLLELRPFSCKLKEELVRLQRTALEMKQDTAVQLACLSELLTNLRTVLTPIQQAKFLIWTQKNKACMQLIHNLWITNTK